MLLEDCAFVTEAMPDSWAFDHYDGREAPLLLAAALGAAADGGSVGVAALRRGPFGRLLDRAPLAGLVARAGGGRLAPGDVALLAHPARLAGAGPLGEVAAGIVAARDWRRYRLGLAVWNGDGRGGMQTTRHAPNLVLQLGFPAAHDAAFRHLVGDRAAHECPAHPVRRDGPITLAWARLDMGAFSEAGPPEVLVEEVQSDWIRLVDDARARAEARRTRCRGCARRAAALAAYAPVLAPYRAGWAATMLAAVVAFAGGTLGARRIWMHRPGPGMALKRIEGAAPPRALYAALPRRFCFRATEAVPPFLPAAARRRLAPFRSAGAPVFWRLDLAPGAALAASAGAPPEEAAARAGTAPPPAVRDTAGRPPDHRPAAERRNDFACPARHPT